MPHSERLFNIAMAVSVFSWAIAGLASSFGQRPTSVLIATTILHLCVAILFLIRRPLLKDGGYAKCLVALPAVLIGGWIFHASPHQWQYASQVVFVAGTAWTVASLTYLGRSFSILPAFRGVVASGPFRLVRHPVYLGELTMVIACLIAMPFDWWQFALAIFAIGFCVARIRVEEDLLMERESYRSYSQQVTWRLVPLVW